MPYFNKKNQLPLIPGYSSGDIVNFSDGYPGAPLNMLKVSVEGSQSGSGNPSPDNVRPITAHSQAVIQQRDDQSQITAIRTASFDQIIYMGTINPLTGDGIITHKAVTFDGSSDENWTPQTFSGNAICFTNDLSDKKVGYQTSICDKFNNVNGSWGSPNTAVYSDHPTLVNLYFCKPAEDFVMNVTNWRNWLASNPVTVAYELENAVPITFTQIDNIPNLSGPNIIQADCGTIELKYIRRLDS